ncbi:MAG: hypothetical protein KC422_10380 [Trueperaceae bacterium]|nr:hypothetical protein [Trueperaceae bacterium]
MRLDILQNFTTLYKHNSENAFIEKALERIELELKYRKKDLEPWKGS